MWLQVLICRVTLNTPGETEDSVRPALWSNNTRVSPRCQHRYNTDRPGLAVEHPLLLPVCLRVGLTNKEQIYAHIFNKRKNNTLLKAPVQRSKRNVYFKYGCKLTTEGRKLFRLSISHHSSQSLFPVLQVTRLQDVMPVLHHHCTDQLQEENTVTSLINTFSIQKIRVNVPVYFSPLLSCCVF